MVLVSLPVYMVMALLWPDGSKMAMLIHLSDHAPGYPYFSSQGARGSFWIPAMMCKNRGKLGDTQYQSFSLCLSTYHHLCHCEVFFSKSHKWELGLERDLGHTYHTASSVSVLDSCSNIIVHCQVGSSHKQSSP